MIGAQGDETPTGRAVRWKLLMAQSGRRLTARPVESEQPGAGINYLQEQQCMPN
ncbi:multidrug transporter [Fictibacillus sp. UD]